MSAAACPPSEQAARVPRSHGRMLLQGRRKGRRRRRGRPSGGTKSGGAKARRVREPWWPAAVVVRGTWYKTVVALRQGQQQAGGAHGAVLGRPMENVLTVSSMVKELGRGQFGVTHLCTHRATGDKLACKTIAKPKLATKEDVDDVRRKVQIMHHLSGYYKHNATAPPPGPPRAFALRPLPAPPSSPSAVATAAWAHVLPSRPRCRSPGPARRYRRASARPPAPRQCPAPRAFALLPLRRCTLHRPIPCLLRMRLKATYYRCQLHRRLVN